MFFSLTTFDLARKKYLPHTSTHTHSDTQLVVTLYLLIFVCLTVWFVAYLDAGILVDIVYLIDSGYMSILIQRISKLKHLWFTLTPNKKLFFTSLRYVNRKS